ncbi:MAG: MATE family efflux transporter [Janthinobacterium lividum]
MRLTTLLGAPLALGELGWMSTYIVDALMVGRLPNSPLAIAASSLGNTIFYAIVFCAIYLLNGLETLIAQAFGRNEEQECVYLLTQAFWIAIIATPIVMLATVGAVHLLPRLGTPPEIVAETKRYTHALIWSTAPLMAYMALRRFLQSINHVVLISVSLVTASVVNFVGDWAFLFGHLGLPAMGVAGSGWATDVVRLYMLLLLIVGTAIAFRKDGFRFAPYMLPPDKPRLRALLKIGWPSGLQNLEELGTSTYLSIICARLGTVLLAAHQVVLDLNAFVYQAPAGLSYATIVRVGQCAGRNNLPEVKRATRASLLLGLGYMMIAATVFAAFAKFWAGLYTNSPAVVMAAAPIFVICAFALMGDTLFVLLSSALTGLGDTRTPLIISLVWNWGIGAPLAYLLAFRFGFALRGLWGGRAIASVGTAVTIWVVWRLRMRRDSREGAPARLNLISSFSTGK